jgi:hypothetical protein
MTLSSKLRATRTAQMTVFSILSILSFFIIIVCMYYLSGLALNSFETSSIFTISLVVCTLVVISSIWGCHRAKEVREADNPLIARHKNTGRAKLSLIFFFIIFTTFIIGYIVLAISAHQNFEVLETLTSKPVDYWSTHPGPEATMLHNFALEFNQMWEAGGCSGNDCVVPDCADSPIALTPLNCTDKSMQTEFEKWSTRSPPTEMELRKCVVYINSLFGGNATTFPIVTWCECRYVLTNNAKVSNRLIFILLLIGAMVMAIFVIPLVTIQRIFLGRVDKEASLMSGRGTDWFAYRIALSRSRVDWPQRPQEP